MYVVYTIVTLVFKNLCRARVHRASASHPCARGGARKILGTGWGRFLHEICTPLGVIFGMCCFAFHSMLVYIGDVRTNFVKNEVKLQAIMRYVNIGGVY